LFGLTVQTKVDAELSDAISAFRAALEVRRPERNRRDWATSRNNLANALQVLAGRKQSTDGLAEAVAAYRDALTEFTRDSDPRQWAIIEHNTGVSLRALAEPDKNIAMLKDAAAALREALTERSEARDGLDWALSTEELGRVLYLIGVWDNDMPSLEQSIGLFESALKLLDAADNRELWLDGQFRLGDALSIIADARQDAGMMRRSADAFGAFVETATVEDSAYHWVVAANGRAWELLSAYRVDGDATRLPEAVDWGRRAVKAATKANDGQNAAYSADTLCEALTELGKENRDAGMAEEAVQACSWALNVMQTMKLDDVIGETQKHLKRAEELLAELK
jgi:tetratricopeptide (TPR) repeat protein